MLSELFVALVLRVRRFRTIAIRRLAYEIRQRNAAERREKQEARRARRRELRAGRKTCSQCAFFGTAACDSRNVRGWCRKFEEK